MRIISLSSIPPRFSYLEPTLKSLVQQNSVDEVRLYIPYHYKRFPKYDGKVPQVPQGVTICRVEKDLGPATKILPAAKEYRGKDVQILFCDDDLYYHQNWAKKLFDIQEKRPNEAVATYGRSASKQFSKMTKKPHAQAIRVEKDLPYRFQRLLSKIFHIEPPLWKPIIRSGYVEMLFGVGGVVVKPEFFDDKAFNIPEEAWAVDDVWLSAQLARNGISIFSPRRFPFARATEAADECSLLETEFMGLERQENNRKAVEFCKQKYGIWQ